MTLKEFNSMCHASDMNGVSESRFDDILEVYTSDDRITKQDMFDIYFSGHKMFDSIKSKIFDVKDISRQISECNDYAFAWLLDQLDVRRKILRDEVTSVLKIVRVGK